MVIARSISAADGTWTLPAVPVGCMATIALADERYGREQREITLTAGEAADSRAYHRPSRRGAERPYPHAGGNAGDRCPGEHQLSGHPCHAFQLDPNLGGRQLSALPDWRQASIPSARAASNRHGWPIRCRIFPLLEGQQTTAPDLHAHAGALLDITVADADTGAPIPGIPASGCGLTLRSPCSAGHEGHLPRYHRQS